MDDLNITTVDNVAEEEVKPTIPNRFGGWLLFIVAGLIIFPFILAFAYIPFYIELISDPLWDILTTKGTVSYNSFLKPLIIVEISYMLSLVLLDIYSIVLFFRKQRFFTKLFIVELIMFTVYPLINLILSKIFPISQESNTDFALKPFILSAVIGLVLIAYMLYSARVRNTFVNPLKPKDE